MVGNLNQSKTCLDPLFLDWFDFVVADSGVLKDRKILVYVVLSENAIRACFSGSY